MSDFFTAMQTSDALTENGAVAHSTTGSECLNLFYTIGAMRGKEADALQIAKRAFAEDIDTAIRILLWSRDVRQGAGERSTFRHIFKYVCNHNEYLAERIMLKIPELGRFDDLVTAFNTPMEEKAIILWVNEIGKKNALAAKWFPREKSKNGFVFNRTVNAINTDKRKWRKILSALSNTVEQKMCAGNWDEIDFGQLPSIAAARYQKAFEKNSKTYSAYVDGLTKGTEKINAGAILLYDIVTSVNHGNQSVANEQWKSLPNYMEGNTELIMPVVDVSGSMGAGINGGPHGGVTCKDVAMSLGVYIAERNEGVFQNQFISFSSDPHFHKLLGNNLTERLGNMNRSGEDMSTDINKVFEIVLQRAKNASLPDESLPNKLLILSDMQFDQCNQSGWGSKVTNFERIKQQYENAGYTMPQLVFWNLRGSTGNVPVKQNDKGVALVSGCSPSILKSLLSGELDPMKIMVKTISDVRYNYK